MPRGIGGPQSSGWRAATPFSRCRRPLGCGLIASRIDAARHRRVAASRVEGCNSFQSMSPPLGCGLIASRIDAARHRRAAASRVEGCNSFQSMSPPLGCGLIASRIDAARHRRAAAWGRRRPAARVPKVRFERALRRLQPESKQMPKRPCKPVFLNLRFRQGTATARSSSPNLRAFRRLRPERTDSLRSCGLL